MKNLFMVLLVGLYQPLFAFDCSRYMTKAGYDLEDELYLVRKFAIRAHGNQKYGDRPYVEHLDEVASVLIRFGYGDLRNPLHITVLKAAYLHDVIEDSKLGNRSELRRWAQNIAGFAAADAAWRVTDAYAPGVNRKARKILTYPKIRGHEAATLVKLADRIANFESSLHLGLDYYIQMYIEEYQDFRANVYVPGIAEQLWLALDRIVINAANAQSSTKKGLPL